MTTPTGPQAISDRLDGVAKTLTTATVAVTGILTALGISSDRITTALNNDRTPIVCAFFLAALAVGMSIYAIMTPPENYKRESVLLTVALLTYLAAIATAIIGASQEARGNGRPSLHEVQVERTGAQVGLTGLVHADGVRRDDTIKVRIDMFGDDATTAPFYGAYLRPDENGVVDHKLQLPFDPGRNTDVSIRVWSSGDQTPNDCESASTIGSGCVRLKIPDKPEAQVPVTNGRG
jgi:cytochrome c-type biogenesis protein CcmE